MSVDWKTKNYKGYYHSRGVAVFTHDDHYITLVGPEEVDELRSMTDEWKRWNEGDEAEEKPDKPKVGDTVYFGDDEIPWTVAEVDIDIFGAPGLKLRTPWQDIYLVSWPTWDRFYAMNPKVEVR